MTAFKNAIKQIDEVVEHIAPDYPDSEQFKKANKSLKIPNGRTVSER